LIASINEDYGTKTQLIFITNFAFIQGELEDSIAENEELSLLNKLAIKAASFRNDDILEKEQEGIDLRPVNDASFFVLKNASIRPFTNDQSHKLQQMILYADQVVGVTIADNEIF